jgi:hypothetical protein
MADFDKKVKEVMKLLFLLLTKGLMIAGIAQLVDRIYGRKGWNENTLGDFAKDLFLETTVYNIPYVQTFVNSYVYDQPVGGMDFKAINDSLKLIKSFGEQASSGDWKSWQTNLYEVLTSVGQFSGIPFKNLYNITMGVWKNVDPSGHEWDALIKGYSDNYILTQYKESVNVNRRYQANGYFELLMKKSKVSVYSPKVQNELVSLTKDGYNAMPKNFMLGYTDENGKQVKLTDEQVLAFRAAYNESNKGVEALMNVTEYRTLTQEEKAKLIKKTYDIYYSYARAKTLKTTADSKLANLLLYTNGKANVGKYINILNTISSITASKTKSRKDLVIDYVNKLSGLSKQEKLLVLHLAGYKTNEMNQNILSSYLRQNGMSINDTKAFLGVE